ncbi:hypothetical protein ACP275_02G193200 [Erythranthe tilingii]
MITENNYKLDVVITHDHDSEEEEQPLMLYADVYDHDYYDEGLSLEMKMEETNNKKERTTLADLFSADSEELDNIININQLKKKRLINIVNNMKDDADDHVIDKMMTLKSSKKSGHSFAKLHKARPPIHKLHRLMRRMMKRKIHPAELGGLNNQFPTNYCKVAAADITESVSLLSS